MHIKWRAAVLALGLAFAASVPDTARAQDQSCTSEQLGEAVDAAGAQLRTFNATTMQSLDGQLKVLQAKRGWSDAERSQQVAALLQDEELAEIDREAYHQFNLIETLSDGPAGPVDCARLEELRGHVKELLAIMERKRTATAALIAAQINPAPQPVVAQTEPAAEPQPEPAKVEATAPAKVAAKVPAPAVAKPAPAAPDPATPPVQSSADWTAQAVLSPQDVTPPMPSIDTTRAGIPAPFTVEEIQNASRGLFGNTSAQLAGVIAHAFREVGQPNGYIMGDEGGGAFLAGVRYGTGKLYLKDGTEQRVYWHGPSIGFDLGASGSRTLFLVYNLKQADDVYRAISGVDGSAYVVGGVGMTLLTDGNIVMAPISAGLGLRLGANAGYLRFSRKESWLPF